MSMQLLFCGKNKPEPSNLMFPNTAEHSGLRLWSSGVSQGSQKSNVFLVGNIFYSYYDLSVICICKVADL